MTELQFFIRHHPSFIQDKFILIFKSDQTRDYFKKILPDCRFEEVTSESAQHAARIGINGKIIPYGYTVKLTNEEMSQLSTMDWETTAYLIAEGNERFYQHILNRRGEEMK